MPSKSTELDVGSVMMGGGHLAASHLSRVTEYTLHTAPGDANGESASS